MICAICKDGQTHEQMKCIQFHSIIQFHSSMSVLPLSIFCTSSESAKLQNIKHIYAECVHYRQHNNFPNHEDARSKLPSAYIPKTDIKTDI